MVTWLEKFLISTGNYRGTCKDYNLILLEICSADMFNELRGPIQSFCVYRFQGISILYVTKTELLLFSNKEINKEKIIKK